ncbi:MAG TPA: hypothetical protein VG777_07265, partial [Thermoanaerobaculia bacterium]|nr:hypothetical protein [Thermoanaerobaculia bacterium]
MALALTLRAIAWPEVTTPAYLWSRGLLLYRDVKFVHTPGMMGLLAAAFRIFGVSAAVLRGFALAGALAAHLFLLASTRRFTTMHRAATSLFFLAFFYGWQGNSVWPVPILAALSIPVSLALEQRRFARAALLVGTMILFKQTSAYVLLPIVAGILFSGNLLRAAHFLLIAALPYFSAAAAFAALGAGRDYFRWTLIVPFATGRAIFSLPGAADLGKIALAFAPLVAWTLGRSPRQRDRRSGWLLATAGGVALIAFPRFDFLELVGAVPCLALGAGRWLEDGGSRSLAFRRATVVTLSASFATTIALGESFDGRILFW